MTHKYIFGQKSASEPLTITENDLPMAAAELARICPLCVVCGHLRPIARVWVFDVDFDTDRRVIGLVPTCTNCCQRLANPSDKKAVAHDVRKRIRASQMPFTFAVAYSDDPKESA